MTKITRRDALKRGGAVVLGGTIALAGADAVALALTPQQQYDAYIQEAVRQINMACALRNRSSPEAISV